MRRKRDRSSDETPGVLYRSPIITEHLIIREATRADARELERTMDDAHFEGGDRTSDGARRFGSSLSEVPVWSATRAVCEKGSARIVGGIVLNEIDDPNASVQRIGFWLQPDAAHYATELVSAADARARGLGADLVVMLLRAEEQTHHRAAEDAGFRRRDKVVHTVGDRPQEFWEYVRP